MRRTCSAYRGRPKAAKAIVLHSASGKQTVAAVDLAFLDRKENL